MIIKQSQVMKVEEFMTMYVAVLTMLRDELELPDHATPDNVREISKFLLLNKETESYRETIEKVLPKAYTPWTPELDEKLKADFASGSSIPILATVFQRTEGAIKSRLLKLGVIQEPSTSSSVS